MKYRYTRRNKIIWASIFTIFFIAFIILAFIVYTFGTSIKGYSTTRGTYSYYMYVPEFFKDFPIIDPISEPKYSGNGIDGTKAGADKVFYTSSADFKDFQSKLALWFNQQGIEIKEEEIVLSDSDNEYCRGKWDGSDYWDGILLKTNKSTGLCLTRSEGEGINVFFVEEYY